MRRQNWILLFYIFAKESLLIKIIQINVFRDGLQKGTLTITDNLKLTFTIWAIFLIGHTNLSSKAEKIEKVLAWLQRKLGAKSHLFMMLKDKEPSSSFISLEQQKCSNTWTWMHCKHVLLRVLSLTCHCPWKPKCHMKISINKGKQKVLINTTVLSKKNTSF